MDILLAGFLWGQMSAVCIENHCIPSVGSVMIQLDDGGQPQIPEETTSVRSPGEIISQDCDLWNVRMKFQLMLH